MVNAVSNFTTITPELLTSAAELAAAAYFDNPAHIYLCPDENTRLQKLEWLLGVNLSMRLKHGAESFCYPEAGIVKAMGFWTKPNSEKINTTIKVRSGLLKVPYKIGWCGFKKVLEVTSKIDDQLSRSFPTQNYLYLNYMVMEESRRCKGWGSKILQHQFDLIKKKRPNSILALQTQRSWTVKFYERHGFEVILQEKIGQGPNSFLNWTMKKEI